MNDGTPKLASTPTAGNEISTGPSTFVVLGLLATGGQMTAYELKRLCSTSIGYFWDFPHSQLYAEANRLTRLGLVSASQEEHGRRRRVLNITDDGRRLLDEWMLQPTEAATQIRDEGLLKLFFADTIDGPATVDLARAQAAGHRRRLEDYRQIDEAMRHERGTSMYATLELGLAYEEAAVKFWVHVAERPPTRRADG